MTYPNKETELVRKEAGKGRAIETCLNARRGNKKYSNYAIYLLDNDQTVYVNLDTMKAHLSEEPNKRMIKAYRQKEQRKLERQQQKEQREAKKAERAAKPKVEPKAKAPAKPKAVKKPRAKKAQAESKKSVVDPLAQATAVSQ
jgi:topoisomerase IA-like protein